MNKKILALVLGVLMIMSTISACKPNGNNPEGTDKADISCQNNTTALFGGVDDLGRVLDVSVGSDEQKAVGIFYFLWLGASSAEGPYDVSKIMATDPNAAKDSVSWLLAGGGSAGMRHWWGESLFGYFRSDDEWVAERDVQMLTNASIDFVAMDYSNATEYPTQLLVFLKALDKYYQQGFKVPKVTFITKASSGQTIMSLYEKFYLGHPEYDHLWYRMDGKPLMIGNISDSAITKACSEYFTFKFPQWPREGYHEDGFPWMDFGKRQTLYGDKIGTTIMSVSLAQHSGTLAMSSSALYGDTKNRTRSYHNGANDPAEDAVLYGYNFAEQFEYAINQDPDIIFVTGWNEWIATRQSSWKDINGEYLDDPIILVDNCDINSSRDIQPMKGGYGDNYYMQLVNYVKAFKGSSITNSNLNTAAEIKPCTINVTKSFAQWNAVDSFYLDYTGDIENRNHKGFGKLVYTDETGRNDIAKMKLCYDDTALYAYVETVADITGMDEDRCMTLFLSTGASAGWEGYDYCVNRLAATAEGLSVEKYGNGAWKLVERVAYKLDGNKLQLAVPLSLLGLNASGFSLQFKWADNYQEEDIFSFYLYGDAAPYGRLNYVYESNGTKNVKPFERAVYEETEGGEGGEDRYVLPATIKGYEVVGEWSDTRIWPNGNEDGNYGPSRSFDEKLSSRWNPCAASNYKGNPGIVYELDADYQFARIEISFEKREYFFEVYGSADGEKFTKISSVTSKNYAEYYTDYVCMLKYEEKEDAPAYRYLKLVFTGSHSSDNNQYVNLCEIAIDGFNK